MRDERAYSQPEGSSFAAVVAYLAAGAVFIATRAALIFRRDEHGDELFTVWLVRKDMAGILETLFEDSGPPLYYALLHGLDRIWPIDLRTARFFSLALAVITLVVVIGALRNATEKVLAAAILAVYPHHVFFSSEARNYAMCALFIGLAAVMLDRWAGSGDRRPLFPVTLSLVAAAYSHYYGVLFFPLPLVIAFLARDRVKISRGAAATAVCFLAYIPGFLLAARQPASVVEWMRVQDDLQRVGLVAGSVWRIAMDGRQVIVDDTITLVVRIVSISLLVIGVVLTLRSRRALRFLAMVAVPIAGAVALAAMGMTAYFPIRFEVVLTVPVVLWFVNAAMQLAAPARNALVVIAVLIGAAATMSLLTRTYLNRGPERMMARFVRQNINPAVPIVASGMSLVELSGQRDRRWNPEVLAWPDTYDIHPMLAPRPADIAAQLPTLPQQFLWVGPAGSAEEAYLRRTARVTPVAGGSAVVALAVRRP